RAVEDVAVPGDPADVGRAPEHLAGPVVEHPLVGQRGEHQVAAAGVQHTLGLAGGAGSVEHEQRRLGGHLLGLAVVAGHLHQLVVPDVAVLVPGNLGAGAAHHDHLAHTAGLGVG